MTGYSIVISPVLPITPTDGENIVRMVRHGLADVLEWLGEDVGPRPGEQSHAFFIRGTMFVSQEFFDKIKTESPTPS